MKRRFVFVAFILGFVLALGIPVVAHHVTEPTAPVTGLTAKLYEYVSGVSTLMKCDGTDRITFDLVRIEPGVSVAAKPSEHFTVIQKVTFTERLDGAARTTFRLWSALWRHQNVPGHGIGGETLDRPWEVAESNQYLHGRLGFWIVEHQVRGEESGAAFQHRCVFERVAG